MEGWRAAAPRGHAPLALALRSRCGGAVVGSRVGPAGQAAGAKDEVSHGQREAEDHEQAGQTKYQPEWRHVAHGQPSGCEGQRVWRRGDGEDEREGGGEGDGHHEVVGVHAHAAGQRGNYGQEDGGGGHVGGEGGEAGGKQHEEKQHEGRGQRAQRRQLFPEQGGKTRGPARFGQSEAAAQQQQHAPRNPRLDLGPAHQRAVSVRRLWHGAGRLTVLRTRGSQRLIATRPRPGPARVAGGAVGSIAVEAALPHLCMYRDGSSGIALPQLDNL
mmetsp:Transcript_16150/g.52621  ORF Transcript_16150/g.52621 Transcript_16150/m.52621 type:complete len:272 (-) Transcript_16150:96-911(-)|eukprot:scaffold2281_cov125-Isochrysis_galbana.AAC.3